jgi:hypothetical protein
VDPFETGEQAEGTEEAPEQLYAGRAKAFSPAKIARFNGYDDGRIILTDMVMHFEADFIHYGLLRETQSGSWEYLPVQGEAVGMKRTFPAHRVTEVQWGTIEDLAGPFDQGNSLWREWTDGQLCAFHSAPKTGEPR